MANPHSQITITKFSGLSTENWQEFESQIRRVVEVANIVDAQRSGYLQLHLQGDALRFFLTLDQAIRENFDNSLRELRNHFCNPNLVDMKMIQLEALKYDPKNSNPDSFLVKLQTLAKQALPDPTPEPVAAADPALDAAAEAARILRENNANDERQRFATQERERLIIRIFKRAMPNWIRLKLVEQPATASIRDLCAIASKMTVFNQLCPTEDLSRDSLNAVTPDLTENLVNALSRLSSTQAQIQDRINSLPRELDEKIQAQKSSNAHQNSGGYRPKFKNSNNKQKYQGNGYRAPFGSFGQHRWSTPLPFFPGYYPQFPPPQYQNWQMPSNAYNSNSGYQQADFTAQSQQTIPGSDMPYRPVTQTSQKFCYRCGLPGHIAKNCMNVAQAPPQTGTQYPLNIQPKN